jgi:hypothetical protein
MPLSSGKAYRASSSDQNDFRQGISLTGQEGGMSTLDLAVMGAYSFVGLIAIGLIVLLATNRH